MALLIRWKGSSIFFLFHNFVSSKEIKLFITENDNKMSSFALSLFVPRFVSEAYFCTNSPFILR